MCGNQYYDCGKLQYGIFLFLQASSILHDILQAPVQASSNMCICNIMYGVA